MTAQIAYPPTMSFGRSSSDHQDGASLHDHPWRPGRSDLVTSRMLGNFRDNVLTLHGNLMRWKR